MFENETGIVVHHHVLYLKLVNMSESIIYDSLLRDGSLQKQKFGTLGVLALR
jgi:hypothetical protein